MKTVATIIKRIFGREANTSAELTVAVHEIETQLAAARAARAGIIEGADDDGAAAEQVARLDSRIGLLVARAAGLGERILETKISEQEALQADLAAQHRALSMKHYELREAFASEIQKLTPRGERRGAAREAIMRAQLETPEMGKIRMERDTVSQRKGDVIGELTQLYKERERRKATVPGQVGVRLS